MIAPHFSKKEVACRCGCGQMIVNDLLVHYLEKIRYKLGKPIIVNSWNRCLLHNIKSGGSVGSMHMYGMAADITVKDDLLQLHKIADAVIGSEGSVKLYANFIHIDVRGYQAIW